MLTSKIISILSGMVVITFFNDLLASMKKIYDIPGVKTYCPLVLASIAVIYQKTLLTFYLIYIKILFYSAAYNLNILLGAKHHLLLFTQCCIICCIYSTIYMLDYYGIKKRLFIDHIPFFPYHYFFWVVLTCLLWIK